MAELCKHELPPAQCDTCTPREPATRKGVKKSGTSSGVENPDTVIVPARGGWPEYVEYHAYVCQPDRSIRDVRWMGFYAEQHIQAFVPEVEFIRERVPFTSAEVDRLRKAGDAVSLRTANLIERLLLESTREPEEEFKVFLLTPPDDPRTIKLSAPIKNTSLDSKGAVTAYVQYQRYTRIDALQGGPADTDELELLEHRPPSSAANRSESHGRA